MGFLGAASHDIVSMIEEATSEMLPNAQEDLAQNLEICDLLKSRQVNARTAMRTIKERLFHHNPNVQLLSLSLTDTAVKNAGMSFLKEISSREFVDTLADISKNCPSEVVSLKCREYWQKWALMLGRSEVSLQYMIEAYEEAKRDGLIFPALSPNNKTVMSSLIVTESPPEWIDGDNCMRCNVAFSLTLRKHHCRKCGKAFCQQCSAKSLPLPELALYEDVRVCEGCYSRKLEEKRAKEKGRSNSMGVKVDPDEDDLQKAIRLSLQQQTAAPVITNPTSSNYDEEAAIAAAIAASLDEIESRTSQQQQQQSTVAPSSPLLMDVDRQVMEQFITIVSQLKGGSPIDPTLLTMAQMVQEKRNSLVAKLEHPTTTSIPSHDIYYPLISRVDAALYQFHELISQSRSIDYATMPSMPKSTASSIIDVSTDAVTTAVPSEDVVPVLKPMTRKSDAMIKEDKLISIDEDDAGQVEPNDKEDDPLAELIIDAPLIQL